MNDFDPSLPSQNGDKDIHPESPPPKESPNRDLLYERIGHVLQQLLNEPLKENIRLLYGNFEGIDQLVYDLIDIGAAKGKAYWERHYTTLLPEQRRDQVYLKTLNDLGARQIIMFRNAPIPQADLISLLEYVQDVAINYLITIDSL